MLQEPNQLAIWDALVELDSPSDFAPAETPAPVDDERSDARLEAAPPPVREAVDWTADQRTRSRDPVDHPPDEA